MTRFKVKMEQHKAEAERLQALQKVSKIGRIDWTFKMATTFIISQLPLCWHLQHPYVMICTGIAVIRRGQDSLSVQCPPGKDAQSALESRHCVKLQVLPWHFGQIASLSHLLRTRAPGSCSGTR